MEYNETLATKTGKSTQVAIRIEDEMFARLDALVTKLSPPGMALPRSEVIRAALAKGLETLEGVRPSEAAVPTVAPYTITLRPRQIAEAEVIHARHLVAIRDEKPFDAWFADDFTFDFGNWIADGADRAVHVSRADKRPADEVHQWAHKLWTARRADPDPDLDGQDDGLGSEPQMPAPKPTKKKPTTKK